MNNKVRSVIKSMFDAEVYRFKFTIVGTITPEYKKALQQRGFGVYQYEDTDMLAPIFGKQTYTQISH